jgi:hypothetical protein
MKGPSQAARASCLAGASEPTSSTQPHDMALGRPGQDQEAAP